MLTNEHLEGKTIKKIWVNINLSYRKLNTDIVKQMIISSLISYLSQNEISFPGEHIHIWRDDWIPVIAQDFIQSLAGALKWPQLTIDPLVDPI